MDYQSLVVLLERDGFNWAQFRTYFPFADVSLREGNYQKAVEQCLRHLTEIKDKELLLDLLDASKAVYLEQLWIENEKIAGAQENNQVIIHFLLAQLQINSNLRYEHDLAHRDMRRRMMDLGADNTIAKTLTA